MEISLGPFHFSSNFECGNLDRVLSVEPPGSNLNKITTTNTTPSSSKKVPRVSPYCHVTQNIHLDYEFNLWTKPDCSGTEFENNNRTWFCFCIRGGELGQKVLLSVMNLNRQFKLYSQGMLPVVQCVGDCLRNSKWERIKEKCTYRSEEGSTVISWVHTVPPENRATYYAFTYPYSYSDLQTYLDSLDKSFGDNSSDIYYERELLTKSLDGSRVDLITISSKLWRTEEREDRLPNLFPDLSTPRPFRFERKKSVFISARVHPGETPSSYVLNGFLNFIISNDTKARKIRDAFVFKIIPMLNPDGVKRGHYRTDQRGVNLNRVYVNPSFKLHPTIYAAKCVIMYYHFGLNLDALLKSEERELGLFQKTSEQLYSNPSLLDEDTCHSFSDAVKNKTETNAVVDNSMHKNRQSILEVDEPSASGWDCSSNLSVESSGRIGSFHPGCDITEGHDDCSNISYIGDGETGVTNMFGSLSPLQEFKIINKSDLVLPSNQAVNAAPFSSLKHTHSVNSMLTSEKLPPDSRFNMETISTRSTFVRDLSTSIASNVQESIFDSTKDHVKENITSNLYMYIDLHGHASKRGIFMYGNWFEDADAMVENMLFPKILSLNCQNFDYGACNFSERNMYHKDRRDGMSKEGSGRVAVMRATGLLRSYTLECNYNTGRIVNPLPTASQQHKSSPNLGTPPKYTAAIFEDCGHKLGVSLFDLIQQEESSKFFLSHNINLSALRSQIRSSLLSSTNSPRVQHISCSPSSIHGKFHLSKFSSIKPTLDLKCPLESAVDSATTSKIQLISQQLTKCSSPHKSSPKLPRIHSTRKSAWTISVDAENQEPSLQGNKSPKCKQSKIKKKDAGSSISSRGKNKTIKIKQSSLKKTFTSQPLFYSVDNAGESSCHEAKEHSINKLTSSKHSLTSSICLTPNISFKVSISDTPDTPKLIKKMERGRKQRNKGVNLVSKKLKTGVPLMEVGTIVDEAVPFIEKYSSQSSLSPRSPLASVCEPQSSQSTQVSGSIAAQPKSPPFAKASKSTYSSAKRPTKHTIKPLSKSLDRLPVVTSATGQRLKLLPKKVKKKVLPPGSSQSHFQWMIREPLKANEEIENPIPKVKKRKKSAIRKAL